MANKEVTRQEGQARVGSVGTEVSPVAMLDNIPPINWNCKSEWMRIMKEAELVKGGCGHTDKEVVTSAAITGACLVAMVIFLIVAALV